MRLIDADALRKELRKKKIPISGADVYYVRQLIDNAPTVYPICEDKACKYRANKRPHGEWIRHIRSIECSVCKYTFFSDENCQDYDPCADFNFNFCPNCGSDMRGDSDDTE